MLFLSQIGLNVENSCGYIRSGSHHLEHSDVYYDQLHWLF